MQLDSPRQWESFGVILSDKKTKPCVRGARRGTCEYTEREGGATLVVKEVI